jgi:hypothetical protein
LKVRLAVGIVVALFALQVWITDIAYRNGQTLQDRNALHAGVMIVSGLLQTAALLFLYRAFRGNPARSLRAIVLGSTIMLLLSFLSANTYPDALAYIGYAKMPRFSEAYSPPQLRFGHAFSEINARWGVRMPPADYGPLWLAFDRITLRHAPDIPTALVILRAFNAIWLCALIVVIQRLGASSATLVALGMNPALYYYFIVQAHNDLLPVLLVVYGILVSRRSPILGSCIAGAAGLMKVTFGLIALAACPRRQTVWRTLEYLAAVIAVVALGSAVFGGGPYFQSLSYIGHAQATSVTGTAPHLRLALHLYLGIAAVISGLIGAFGQTFGAPLTYVFSTLAPLAEPNYLIWCLPYAIRMPGFTGPFLVTLPGLTHAIDAWFSPVPRYSYAMQDAYCIVIALVSAIFFLTTYGFPRTRLGSLLQRRS